MGLHNVRIQEAIGLLKATSCELVIHIHLSPVIRPVGPCHCLEGLQEPGGRQQRLLDTECSIVLDWQHPTGRGGERWVGGARPPRIVIPCTMGLGAGVRSRSWELELLGERMTVVGTWLQVWCPRELERRSGALLAGGFSRSLPRASVRKNGLGIRQT